MSPHHPTEIESVDVEAPRAFDGRNDILYVRLPGGLEPLFIDNELNRILDSATDDWDWVVIRCHPSLISQLEEMPEVRNLLTDRFPYARLSVICWNVTDQRHETREMRSFARITDDEAQVLELARAIDFCVGLEQPGAMLPQNPEFHYEGPNHLHYEAFVRAGYAFQSVDAMQGAAFWMLPSLSQIDYLILDSWTMLGFGHTVAQYASVNAQGPDQLPIQVECAEEYGETSHLIERLEVRRASSTAASHRAAIVTSVHSTGNTESRLIDACVTAGVDAIHIIRVYSSAAAPPTDERISTLHTLQAGVRSSERTNCPSCLSERKSVVPVDRRSLLLALTAAVEETRITRPLASEARSFLEEYKKYKAFRIHKTEDESTRHHMVYLHVEKLLDSDVFLSRLADTVRSLAVRPDVVLSPSHEAAKRLAEIIGAQLGVPVISCEQRAYQNLSGEEREQLSSAANILFVDDVAITGRRVRRVKHELMHSRLVTDDSDVQVQVLVGVARPPSPSALSGVIDFVGRDSFRWVEYMELPNWDSAECPWCTELLELTEFAATHSVSELLHQRLVALQDVRAGLSSDLFIPSARDAGGRGKTYADQPITRTQFNAAKRTIEDHVNAQYLPFSDLGQGSIFGRLKQVDLFVAVAASMQKLRNNRSLSERAQYPVARVLDPHLYFFGRFYANLIVACILRASRRRDVRTVSIEGVLRQAVGERLSEQESKELHAELIFAMSRTHLPIPAEASEASLYGSLDDSVRDYLWWLLQSRH